MAAGVRTMESSELPIMDYCLFPPPGYDFIGKQLASIQKNALIAGLNNLLSIKLLLLVLGSLCSAAQVYNHR